MVLVELRVVVERQESLRLSRRTLRPPPTISRRIRGLASRRSALAAGTLLALNQKPASVLRNL